MSTQLLRRLKPRSHVVTDGPERAGARAMLRATGLTDDDFNKPFVAVANLASDITPCNVHLSRLAQKAKEGHTGCGQRSLPLRDHHGQRRHLHGHRGDEGLPGEPRGHR